MKCTHVNQPTFFIINIRNINLCKNTYSCSKQSFVVNDTVIISLNEVNGVINAHKCIYKFAGNRGGACKLFSLLLPHPSMVVGNGTGESSKEHLEVGHAFTVACTSCRNS